VSNHEQERAALDRLGAALDVPTELLGGEPNSPWHALDEERRALAATLPTEGIVPDHLLPPEFAAWLRERGYQLVYGSQQEEDLL
jgi:hypothetical protein